MICLICEHIRTDLACLFINNTEGELICMDCVREFNFTDGTHPPIPLQIHTYMQGGVITLNISLMFRIQE